jgi:hypothetical protein
MDKNGFLFEQWKMASELHKHEDNLLWQRFSYFVTLTGILVSGLAIFFTADKSNIASDINIDVSKYQYAFMAAASFFGAIVSLVFASIFKRAYLYHILRICQAEEAEKKLQQILKVDFWSPQPTDEKETASQFSVYEKDLASDLLSKLCEGRGWAELWEEKHPPEPRKSEPKPGKKRKKRCLEHFFSWLAPLFWCPGRCSWCFARPGTYNVIFCLSLFMVLVWVGIFIVGFVYYLSA